MTNKENRSCTNLVNFLLAINLLFEVNLYPQIHLLLSFMLVCNLLVVTINHKLYCLLTLFQCNDYHKFILHFSHDTTDRVLYSKLVMLPDLAAEYERVTMGKQGVGMSLGFQSKGKPFGEDERWNSSQTKG
ncbi:hypothetical protein BDQ17DRAFT_1324454 [Cyathus striatus]|nr:hypothetical protein BDQ17DRAFT_1324454 [Cyathus striatus]